MDKQRPPIYNPEDYAKSLKKWIKLSSFQNIYITNEEHQNEKVHDSNNNIDNSINMKQNNYNDQFNYYPLILADSKYEMALKQFKTVSDLLNKLRIDLNVAYPSFVQEFVGDPLDGVNLLMNLLKMIVIAVNGKHNNENQYAQSYLKKNFKLSAIVQRKALIDEYGCLQCILYCCTRYSEAIRRLAATNSLYTLAVGIMSNMNKSRIIALQLLTMVCTVDNHNGHTVVSEALSTLRLRFSEPVRFRFLVGIIFSTIGNNSDLLYYCLRFINIFAEKSESIQKKMYIQAELEQAGFDHIQIKKLLCKCSKTLMTDEILSEINKWNENRIDVEQLIKENGDLKRKVSFLENKVQKLQEEKVINEFQSRKIYCDKKNDDEGISSSERSTISDESGVSNRNELTTIDDVIEEMNNMVKEVESKSLNESKIIPGKLQPLPPPKRVKSLIYLNKYSDSDMATNLDFYENKTLNTESCSNSQLSVSEIFIENYKRNCIENFDKCGSMLENLPSIPCGKRNISLRKSMSFHHSDKCSIKSAVETNQIFKPNSFEQLYNEDNNKNNTNNNNIPIKLETTKINVHPDWKYEETRFYKENATFLPNSLFKRKMFDDLENNLNRTAINLEAVKDSSGCSDNFYLNKSISHTYENHTMIKIIKNNFTKSLSTIDDITNNFHKKQNVTKISDLPSGLY